MTYSNGLKSVVSDYGMEKTTGFYRKDKDGLYYISEVKKMDDEIIEVNKTNYSLRKILDEDGWSIYCKASERVKDITRLRIRMDLLTMETGFARLDKMFKHKEVRAVETTNDGIPPRSKD